MKATYGFRATMTARSGKGDELVALLLSATTGEGPATSKDCLLFLVGRSADEVPMGGKFSSGGAR